MATVNSQSGVTLLMTILVLAGVVLITVTVSVLAINELRASRGVILSEPAITAAESSGERGIWELKRQGSIQSTNVVLGNGVVSNKSVLYSSATFTIKAGIPTSFFLYDPNNLNGDLTPGYYSLLVSNRSSIFTVYITIQTIDGQVFVNNQAATVNSITTISNLPGISPGSDERYKITLTSNGDATVDASTLDANGVSLGLPDYPTVDAKGCSAQTGLTACTNSPEVFIRRLNIVVPR